MRTPKDSTPVESKQKTLSIHITTDHVGPHGMPLVYGSTPDKIGTIKGVVRFSSNYDCRGRDIVIMYEAKAEAQWTVFENKKVVNHNTEEMFGHHTWNFALEHTRPNGLTVAAGVYEKEFEVSLVHPSAQIQSSTPPPVSSSPSANIHTSANTMSKPVTLLPSSSYSPNAKIKYTIRAILRRPFPCVTNIEASQEVWVIHSSLPPPAPPKSLTQPPTSVVVDHEHCGSRETDPLSSALTVDATPAVSTSPKSLVPSSPSGAVQESPSPSEAVQEPSPSTSSESFISLSMPTKVIKSALSMFPTIDLSRPKHLFPFSLSVPPTPNTPAFEPTPENPRQNQAAAQSSIITPTSQFPESPSEPKSSTPPKASASSSRSSSRSSSGSARRNSSDTDDSGLSDEENPVNYTGTWEPFQIPYSCSVPSETVCLGQKVPITIRFGPRKGDYRKRSVERRTSKESKRKDKDRRKHRQHDHKHDSHEDDHDHDLDGVPPGPRFVVKKGIVKVVEHTVLREVSVVPMPPKLRSQRHALTLTNNASVSTHRLIHDPPSDKQVRDLTSKQQPTEQQQQQQQQQQSSGLITIPDSAKSQTPEKIYQNHTYSGSHSHLYDLLHREIHTQHPASKAGIQEQQEQELPPKGHRRNESNDIKKRLFFMPKPKRHSLDMSIRNMPSPPQSPPPFSQDTSMPTSPLSPLHNLSPRSPSPNSVGTRIINTVEAKFKTETLVVPVTSHLQQRERRYLRNLYKKQHGDHDDEQRYESQEDDYEEDEDREQDHGDEEGDEDSGVWQTTFWIQLPGPSELSTFTETKHIVKRHTLQLILLCGLVDVDEDAGGPSAAVVAERRIASDSVITQPGVNKEFRLEMDLHVTGPRAPA
ncbi:hypothetical protein EDD21DRAFT_405719 [Dissophora ornata]|nr:hypothetical protein EDD21DRAFT_405719 [Dissophora ornata]